MGFAGLQWDWRMFNTKPYDKALADFKCEMSQARLRITPPEEIALALGRDPRGTLQTMSAVYLIANDANDLVKIGYADNLKSRMSGLGCGSPVELRLIHFIYLVDGFIAKSIEGDTHKILAAQRRKGEWFDVSPEEAGEAIAQAVNSKRVKWWTELERRKLSVFVKESYARYEERQRFFGT